MIPIPIPLNKEAQDEVLLVTEPFIERFGSINDRPRLVRAGLLGDGENRISPVCPLMIIEDVCCPWLITAHQCGRKRLLIERCL